jgi:hypothetical protein
VGERDLGFQLRVGIVGDLAVGERRVDVDPFSVKEVPAVVPEGLE